MKPANYKSVMKQLHSRLSYVRRIGAIVWVAAGLWNIAWLGLLIVQGVIPAALVYMTKWLVDTLTVSLGGGASWETGREILVPAAVMGGLLLAQRTLSGFAEWVGVVQSERVQDHIKRIIHDKAITTDYAYFEMAEHLDLLDQANRQAVSNTLSIQRTLGGLLSSVVTLISVAVLLMQYAWWLPLVLLVGTLPGFIVLVRHNRKYHAWWKRATQEHRWASYYDIMLTVPSAAAEVRLYRFGEFFRDTYQEIRKRLRKERVELVKHQAIARFGAGVIALIVTGATMGWIAWRALIGLATLGDVALFYQAFNQGQSLLGTILSGMGQIYANTLFIQHLFEYLDQPQLLDDPDIPVPFPSVLKEGIAFSGVSFRYPGSDRYVLKDLDLFIPAGKVVAVVGENGAGKSTFTKLLCRFYDPDAGCVTIDGFDVREMRKDDLRRHISVMVQDPTRYQQSVEQNIRMGDLHRDADLEEVMAAARGAGAHEFIQGLPNGYDTLLGRWFSSGVELSGGQWQRIALARAFFRQAPILILDEPTSFMDSWAEIEWMKRFRELVRGRTALFITHRFTTAMQADIIHVMRGGRVIESGTHHELLALGGHYATSWHQQMQAARSGEVMEEEAFTGLESQHARFERNEHTHEDEWARMQTDDQMINGV